MNAFVNFRNPFERCTREALELYSKYLNVLPSSYYCFPKGSEIELMGVMNKGKSSLVRLQLDFCKNNTDINKGTVKTDCYTREETQKFLSSKRIQMNYIIETANIESTNYTQPGSRYVYSNSINTNAFSWTRLNILFKKIVVDTDVGFFVEDTKKWEVMALESVTSESYYSPETDTVFSFLIGNSPWKEIYSRYYIKIQDVFAMMGGFLNASIIILKFAVEFIARPKLVDYFNKSFKFQYDESFKNLKSKSAKQGNYPIVVNKNYFVESSVLNDLTKFNRAPITSSENIFKLNKIKCSNDIDSGSISQLLNNMKDNDYELKMNSWKRVFRCCLSPKKDNQINVYYKLEAKLNKILGLENYFKISKNVKFLKKILFEEHLNEIIKICPAPRKKNYTNSMNYQKISENMLKGLNEEKSISNTNHYKLNTKLYELLF
jgi:hypothetical protein